MLEKNYDFCILGGGMTGAALALGLAQINRQNNSQETKYKIALIEKHPVKSFESSQAPDLRLSAINMHTVGLFKALGAWSHLQNMRTRIYDTLSVWDAENPLWNNRDSAGIKGRGGFTQFSAKEVKQNQLGYFAENRLIQLSLYMAMKANNLDNIECISQHTVESISAHEGNICLKDPSGQKSSLNAPIIFGADGANSLVRQAAGIATSGWQYSQYANAILINTAKRVANETWQAFYSSGPRALLPMYNNYACLVWYDDEKRSKWIQNAEKNELKTSIQTHFPHLTTDFEIINVAGFGLTRMHANQYGRGKAIILGDAAHTINPLAGQGVNLGFKDVAALLDIIKDRGAEDVQSVIREYEAARKTQNLLMMSAMDVLYKGFSSKALPVKVLRSLGFVFADKAGPIKQQALKYAMGI